MLCLLCRGYWSTGEYVTSALNSFNFCHMSHIIKSKTIFQNYMKRAFYRAQKLYDFKKGLRIWLELNLKLVTLPQKLYDMIFFSYHDNCKDELETYRMANKNDLKTQLYHPKFFLNFVVGLPTSNEIFSAISWWHHRKLFLLSFLNQRLKMFNDT